MQFNTQPKKYPGEKTGEKSNSTQPKIIREKSREKTEKKIKQHATTGALTSPVAAGSEPYPRPLPQLCLHQCGPRAREVREREKKRDKWKAAVEEQGREERGNAQGEVSEGKNTAVITSCSRGVLT